MRLYDKRVALDLAGIMVQLRVMFDFSMFVIVSSWWLSRLRVGKTRRLIVGDSAGW